MIDPDVALNSVLAALQSIPQLVSELGGPTVPATQSIRGHVYYSGEENALARDVAQMLAPSMLLAYQLLVMASSDGQTLWRHTMNLWIRARNKATDPMTNHNSASAQHLYWMAMNLPISNPEVASNIRYVDLCNHSLWLFQTNMPQRTDEMGQDYLICPLIFNEMGDAGPDGLEFLCIGPQGASDGVTHTE